MHRLFIWLVCLSLAGCFSIGRQGDAAAPEIHDLGLPPVPMVTTARAHAPAIEVRVPLWLDSTAIDYRLVYLDASQLRTYARVRWAGAPSRLIEARLGRQLAMSPAGRGRADCVLRIDISEFSQVFSSPVRSKGVLLGRAQWLDRSRRPLATLDLDIEKPAPTADSRGGIGALQAAVDQLAIDLQGWANRLASGGLAGGCAP